MPVKIDGCEDVWFKQHAVIEFLTAENIPPINIHRYMQAVYGGKCIDVSTVTCWVCEFKKEEVRVASLCDKARLGRPVTVTDDSSRMR